MANGIADNMLITTYLSAKAPVLCISLYIYISLCIPPKGAFHNYRIKFVHSFGSYSGAGTPHFLPASMHLSNQTMFRARVRMV